MNYKCFFGGHKWNFCTCTRCGKLRRRHHDWRQSCKCSVCGMIDLHTAAKHKWDGCKCSSCGKVQDEGHRWENHSCVLCGKIQPRPVHSRGGAGEPFCSQACRESSGNAAFEYMFGRKASLKAGPCDSCNSYTADPVILGRRYGVIRLCTNCVRSYTLSMEKCCYCDADL